MFKRSKISLPTGVFLILIMTIAIYANATSSNYTIGPDGTVYNNNPAYELVSNLNSTKIKTEKQKASEVYEKNKDIKNLVIEKVKLTTYSKAMKEDMLEEAGSVNETVSPDRLVYVIIKHYKDGVDTKVGFVEDAKVYVLMDAETERVISVRTVGKVKDFKRP